MGAPAPTPADFAPVSLPGKRAGGAPTPLPARGRGLARFLAALLLLLPAPALADAISARPEAVAVTIYRDGSMTSQELAQLGADDTHGLALVVETRTVDLPAGRTRV